MNTRYWNSLGKIRSFTLLFLYFLMTIATQAELVNGTINATWSWISYTSQGTLKNEDETVTLGCVDFSDEGMPDAVVPVHFTIDTLTGEIWIDDGYDPYVGTINLITGEYTASFVDGPYQIEGYSDFYQKDIYVHTGVLDWENFLFVEGTFSDTIEYSWTLDNRTTQCNNTYTLSKNSEIQFLWPNGDPVRNTKFSFDNKERITNDDGIIDLKGIPVTRTEDSVYLQTQAGKDPFRIRLNAPIDIEVAADNGSYTLELCGWVQETVKLYKRYHTDYLEAKSLESNIRETLEIEYVYEKIAPNKWFVLPQTPLVDLVNAGGSIVKAIDPKSWLKTTVDLFFSFSFNGDLGPVWGAAKARVEGKLTEWGAVELFEKMAFQTTLDIADALGDSTQAYLTEEAAIASVRGFQNHMLKQWETYYPHYESLRKTRDELNQMWEEMASAPAYIRGKASNPEACISSADLNFIRFPLPDLPLLEKPVISSPNPFGSVQADQVEFIIPGMNFELKPQLPNAEVKAHALYRKLEAGLNTNGETYTWILIQPDELSVVGHEETLVIPSFALEDAGIYEFTAFDSTGEVFYRESFGAYLANDAVPEPVIESLLETRTVSLVGTFIFAPEISSQGPTFIQWTHNGVPLSNPDPVLVLSEVTPDDTGTYSVEISNAGGSIAADILQLTVGTPTGGMWGQYPVLGHDGSEFAQTDGWLGVLDISLRPWQFHTGSDSWIYIPEAVVSDGSSWMYIPSVLEQDSPLQIEISSDPDWAWSLVLGRWLYLTDSGWVFLM